MRNKRSRTIYRKSPKVVPLEPYQDPLEIPAIVIADTFGIDGIDDSEEETSFIVDRAHNTPQTFIPVTEINLTRQGLNPSEQCRIRILRGETGDGDVWLQANRLLRAWAQTFPHPFYGELVPVEIWWSDGTPLEFRYPLTVADGRQDGGHLVGVLIALLGYYAGRMALDEDILPTVNWTAYVATESPIDSELADRLLDGGYDLIGGVTRIEFERSLNATLHVEPDWDPSQNLTPTILHGLWNALVAPEDESEFFDRYPEWEPLWELLLTEQDAADLPGHHSLKRLLQRLPWSSVEISRLMRFFLALQKIYGLEDC